MTRPTTPAHVFHDAIGEKADACSARMREPSFERRTHQCAVRSQQKGSLLDLASLSAPEKSNHVNRHSTLPRSSQVLLGQIDSSGGPGGDDHKHRNMMDETKDKKNTRALQGQIWEDSLEVKKEIIKSKGETTVSWERQAVARSFASRRTRKNTTRSNVQRWRCHTPPMLSTVFLQS